MNMKFLVTGAAGFIGFHASQRLLEAGHEVVGIDNMNDYYDVNLKQSAWISCNPPCSAFTKPISPIAKAWRKFSLLRSLIA
jgi:UDP-glucuronate 4-epimerase